MNIYNHKERDVEERRPQFGSARLCRGTTLFWSWCIVAGREKDIKTPLVILVVCGEKRNMITEAVAFHKVYVVCVPSLFACGKFRKICSISV